MRALHAFDAGNAVVNCHQQIGAALVYALSDAGREAVAVLHAIGNDVGSVFGAEQTQAANRHGAGGGAVAVVVGDDADALVLLHGVGQQDGSLIDAFEFGRRQQLRQAFVELGAGAQATRSEQARQQRVDAGLLKRPGGARRHIAHDEFQSDSKIC